MALSAPVQIVEQVPDVLGSKAASSYPHQHKNVACKGDSVIEHRSHCVPVEADVHSRISSHQNVPRILLLELARRHAVNHEKEQCCDSEAFEELCIGLFLWAQIGSVYR